MFKELFINIFIIVASLFLAGQVFKNRPLDRDVPIKRKVLVGIYSGISGICLMIYSIHPSSIMIVDLRHIAIILAALYGGLIASMIATFIIIGFRLVFYGVNSASLIASSIAVLIGIFCGVISTKKYSVIKKYIFMNIFSIVFYSLGFVLILLNKKVLEEVLLYYVIISFLGGVFTYYLSEYIKDLNIAFREMQYYRIMSDNLTELVTTNKPDGTYTYLSSTCETLLGYKSKELVGKNPYWLIHPDDYEIVKHYFSSILNLAEIHTEVYRIKRKDGKYIWLETTSKDMRDKDGAIKELISVSRDITSRKEMEDEILKSHELNINILESIEDAFFVLDNNWCFTYINKEAETLFSRKREELLEKCIWDEFPEAEVSAFYNEYHNVMSEKKSYYFEEFSDPLKKWFRVAAYPGKEGISVYYHDITEIKQGEQLLIDSENKFRSLINSMNDIVFTLDTEGRYTGVYGNWVKKYGIGSKSLIGQTPSEIFGPEKGYVHEEAEKQTLKGEGVAYDWSQETEGKIEYYQTSLSPIKNSEGNITGIVGVGRNITDKNILEEKLRELSYKDGLTLVFNRRYFDEAIEKEWEKAARKSSILSLIMLDIDYFKAYNDTYGHQQGDDCLKAIARTLNEAIKTTGDLVSRYGGEEFTIILPETNEEGAIRVAESIRHNVEELMLPNINSKVKPFVTLSAGIATIVPTTLSSCKLLIHNADKALYKAKESGRNRYEIYCSTSVEANKKPV